MHALTPIEAREWCAAHGIRLDGHGLPSPDFSESQVVNFHIPGDTGQRIALLHCLFGYIPEDRELLVWFDDWGVWPSGESCPTTRSAGSVPAPNCRRPELFECPR